MMGPDYALKAPAGLLMVKRNDSHPTERADLFRKRLVVCSETEQGKRLAESLVKDLTGGERIRARRMREDFWEFSPTHKMILCTNHKPEIKSTDHAIWRRPWLVPFMVTIPEGQQDKRLPDKLRAEAQGILAWAVRGCRDWQQDGLGLPEEVRAATAQYREEQDVLAAFLSDCCQIGPEHKAKRSDLYDKYQWWCRENRETEVGAKEFGMAMTERGFERYKDNVTYYRGVGLTPQRLE